MFARLLGKDKNKDKKETSEDGAMGVEGAIIDNSSDETLAHLLHEQINIGSNDSGEHNFSSPHLTRQGDALTDSGLARFIAEEEVKARSETRGRGSRGDALSDSGLARFIAEEEAKARSETRSGGGRGGSDGDVLFDSGLARFIAEEEAKARSETRGGEGARGGRGSDGSSSLTDSQLARKLSREEMIDQHLKYKAISARLKCFASFDSRLENTNRVILPESLLNDVVGKERADGGGGGGGEDGLFSSRGSHGPLLLQLKSHGLDDRRTFVGVKEFSAPDGVITVPFWIMQELLLRDGDWVLVRGVYLPMATHLSLQPLDYSFSELNDSDGILEANLGKGYACVVEGETISIPDHMGSVHTLLVKKCKPAPAVCLVGEAHISVELVPPLHTHQLKNIKELPLGEEDDHMWESSLLADTYDYYAVVVSEHDLYTEKCDLVFEVHAVSGDPDLYVSTTCQRPNRREHQWLAATTGGDEIVLTPSTEGRIPATYFIGVRAHKVDTQYRIGVYLVTESQKKKDVKLAIESGEGGRALRSSFKTTGPSPPGPDYTQCNNCLQWIPNFNFDRHQLFCDRNNWRCTVCGVVLRVVDKEEHYHCKKCEYSGDPALHSHCDVCDYAGDLDLHSHCTECGEGMNSSEIEKHNEITHTLVDCYCGIQLQMAKMLIHKQKECPLLPKKCKYCLLEFPSKDIKPHASVCGMSITAPCDHCGSYFPLKKMATHYADAHKKHYFGRGAPSVKRHIPPITEDISDVNDDDDVIIPKIKSDKCNIKACDRTRSFGFEGCCKEHSKALVSFGPNVSLCALPSCYKIATATYLCCSPQHSKEYTNLFI